MYSGLLRNSRNAHTTENGFAVTITMHGIHYKENTMNVMDSYRLALIAACAGSTLAQTTTYDQGTIDRQRLRLDDSTIAPSTGGWLNNKKPNHFWAWQIDDVSVDPYDKIHSDMQLWIHQSFWGDTISISGGVVSINYTSLDSQAAQLADRIVDRIESTGSDQITSGDYGIFFFNVKLIDLHEHIDDNLDDTVHIWDTSIFSCTPPYSTGTCDDWANLPPLSQSLARASVWRENGVTLADTIIEYLTDKTVAEVLAHPDFTGSTFPHPLRIFFDEERGRQYGLNHTDNLAAIESITSDSRWNSEALYGNFDLWDSTPATSYANEVLTNTTLLASIDGWNSACTEFTPNAPTNAYTACNSNHQNPQYDIEFFAISNQLSGIYKTLVDGALGAAFDHPINDADWGGFRWSNYNTSLYYTQEYPNVSASRHGATNPVWHVHEGFGFAQSASMGSSEMQSPVLYPPSDYQTEELESDGVISFDESDPTEYFIQESRAWTRQARTELDHIIFSFPVFEDAGIDSKPHIAPWVTRVGTTVHRPSVGYDSDITTKYNVRNIVALCKAKGINEILFWGDPGNHANGKQCDGTTNATYQYNWDATNDILSQVYEYKLTDVLVDGLSIGTEKKDLEFSEEHTHNFSPVYSGSWKSTFEAEFDIGKITTLGDNYTFVSEVLDGGGPWENGSYKLAIYNYTTSSYETISDSPEQWYSKSTRRAIFTDTDMIPDDYANTWTHTFDDDIANVSDVYDRKTIKVWDQFELPVAGYGSSLGDYTSGSKMKLKLTVSHNTLLPIGDTADPLRVDLVQLYESECANDNIASMTLLAGDLTGDGEVDYMDVKSFVDRMLRGDHTEIDLNGDGQVNQSDLDELNKLIQANNS